MPREVDAKDLEQKWNARLRTPITSPRIAAMAANAGLSCLFWSIVQPSGLPFAEIALPAGTEAEAVPIQLGTFRIVSESEDLARAAAGFRSRAITEFSAAPGMPVTVRLYLPWFCVLPSVDAMGVPLRTALANTGLAAGRVIVELATPMAGGIPSAARRIAELRELGVQTALRVEEVSPAAFEAAVELVPDYVHVVEAPRSFDESSAIKALLDGFRRKKTRAIVGNVSVADDAAHVDGLGVSLLYGDAISAPRFLC
ncbi:MAG: hypothetical protein HOV80_29880 [Polyangiaceae bacterium]|nr:hypothetical protein [Polyangiaceae bacterium]